MSGNKAESHPSFFIRTFGCQMNFHDSEHVAGVLRAAGYRQTGSAEGADVIVFNTCCVREGAEDRVWGNLGSLAGTRGPGGGGPTVAVCGCMAQRHGVEILRRFPAVSLVFGEGSLERLPRLLVECGRAPVCDLGEMDRSAIDRLPAERTSPASAWVPVSHGCDNMCSYCVVPFVRGRERCRPPGEVVEEVRRLAAEGVLEVTLLGQNVNSYGRGAPGGGFAGLLGEVCRVPGIRRVKFETSHPRDLAEEILEVMAEEPAACEYLHLPVQSGSDRVLRLMNRGYTRDYYLGIASRARERVPGVALSTDMIVGFPGETEKDFEETLDLVRRARFDSAYMFIYSPREGTAAFEMEDDVSPGEKKERFDRLAALQEEMTGRSLEGCVGLEVEALVERPGRLAGQVVARTRGHRVVVLSEREAGIGSLVSARITGAGGHSLRGTVTRVLEAPAPPRCSKG